MRWTGTTLEDIAAGGQGNFYLYNVGKKMFLSQGGLWGTSTEVSESGLQIQALVPADSDKYYVETSLKREDGGNTDPGYLNFADGKNITNNTGHFFLDQKQFSCGKWKFTEVSDNPKVYTMSVKILEGNAEYRNKTYYLSAESSSFAVEPTTVANGEYSQWMLVTLKEIKDDFNNADNASVSSPTPSPFFFSCPGFCRRDLGISEWYIRESKQQLTVGLTNVPLESTGDKVETFTDNITPSNAVSGKSLKYTYYIGNGYIKGTDTNLDPDLNETPYQYNWQSLYGKDWTANIHGSSGIIQQTISSSTAGWTPGWYKVTCKGFSKDGTGKLFAYSGTTPSTDNTDDKYQIATFIKLESTPATYVKASRLINDGTAAFEQSVTVYVGQGESLTFGVEVKDGSASSWTCFDSFALSYCGKGELNLIISEDQESIDYLNQQVNREKNQTLRLKRNLNPGQWNSIVLPVTLNAGQVKTAFGTTKLAKLNGADKNRIYFELVNLDDDAATAIEAGKLYIINPQNKMPTDQTEKHHSVEVPKPYIRDYYTINQVTFSEVLTESRKEDKLWDGATSDGGMMQMVGTYVAIPKVEGAANPIPANSYVLSGGKWIYATNGVSKVQGLRGWIETGIGNTSKSLIFNIDGVDEEEVSTGIDGLFVDGAETNTSISKTGVYSLSGQKISDNTNLPKGIYIVNGRKMIVK